MSFASAQGSRIAIGTLSPSRMARVMRARVKAANEEKTGIQTGARECSTPVPSREQADGRRLFARCCVVRTSSSASGPALKVVWCTPPSFRADGGSPGGTRLAFKGNDLLPAKRRWSQSVTGISIGTSCLTFEKNSYQQELRGIVGFSRPSREPERSGQRASLPKHFEASWDSQVSGGSVSWVAPIRPAVIRKPPHGQGNKAGWVFPMIRRGFDTPVRRDEGRATLSQIATL